MKALETLLRQIQEGAEDDAVRGKAAEALQRLRSVEEDEARLRALYDHAPVAYFTVAPDGRIQDANHAAAVLTGRRREELAGTGFVSIFAAGESGVGRARRWIDRMARGERVEDELLSLQRGDDLRWVAMTAQPVQQQSGGVRFHVILLDVTERQESRSKQTELEGQMHQFVESAPDAIVIVDGEGVIVRVNRQVEGMFGYDRDEILGKRVEALIPERFSRHAALRTEYMEDPHARPMGAGLDLFARRQDGSEFPVEISLSPMESEEGTLVMAAVRDITDRKRMEAQRREAEKQLREVDEIRSRETFRARFINAAAHELNTPLTPMLMQLRLLQMGERHNLTDRQRRAVEIITRNANRFQILIQDLLEVGRYQAGKLWLDRRPVDLHEVAREAVENFRPAMQEVGLHLDHRGEGPVTISGDENRLTQILDNLLGNARKFTPRGGRVEVHTRIEDGEAVMDVADTGLGMDPDRLPEVFEPFTQFHLETQGGERGSGLGLYLVKVLVEMQDGTIKAASEGTAKGTRFTIRFPLVSDDGPGPAVAALHPRVS